MKHTYKITGMTCQGCRSNVENALNGIEGISAKVSLEAAEAVITMEKHIPTEKLQAALSAVGNYRIEMSAQVPHTDTQHMHEHAGHARSESAHQHHDVVQVKIDKQAAAGVYYCPMHCEGDKIYDKPGYCPVCGMDLLKQPVLKKASQFTCPMHPEIVKDQPGSCPICGMDLVPLYLPK